jgi:hypothetical protein
MTIQPLNISYPDFVLNTVIDPEQFDTNNAELVNKINELLTVLHSINGAKEIIADAIPGFIGSVDLQAMLVALKAKIDSNDEWITADVIEKHDGVLSAINTISGNIDSLSFAKADKATTYLRTELYKKTEVDGLMTTHKASADHDGRYFTEAEINTMNTNHKASTSVDHDNRYYTETEIDTKVGVLNTADTTNANNLTTHKTSTDHDGRYYTRTEVDTANTNHKNSASTDHDNRYYTETELSAIDGIKGSTLIGTPPITGIAGTNVKEQLASLKENINQVAIAGIPDGSVTAIKMANDMKKDIAGGIVAYNTYKSELTNSFKVPVTTNQLVNSISVNSNKVVNVDLQGKTVVNLLGSDGDCEDVNKFLQYQSTRILDNINKVFGNNGLKVTLSTGYTTGSVNPGIRDILDINKYYCVSVYVKNGNATEASLKVDNGYSGLVNIINTTDTTKFNRLFMKLNPTQHSNTIRIILQVSGIEGQYAYFDGIMLEEITEAQYNDPNFKPSEYVNSDMSVGEVSTKVKTVGKNLFNGEVELGLIDVNGYKSPGTACVRSINYTNVKENTSYILSSDMAYTTLVFFYNEAKSRISDISSLSFTTPVGCKYIMFRTSTGANQNNINVKFQLEEGTTATTYESYKETYLDVPVLKSIPSGIKDEIVDNKLIKKVEKVVLDGSLGWLFGASIVGAKRVYLPNDTIPNSITLGDGQLIRYDGKIVTNTKADGNAGDTFYLSSNSIRIYIPSSVSGWGDSYNPTNAEIQACMFGWVMMTQESWATNAVAYNGVGTKGWAKRYCGTGTYDTSTTLGQLVQSSGTGTLPTVMNDQGYTPYRLYYQLATPVTTEIIKPNLIAYPSGTLNIETDTNVWVIPNIIYTITDSEKANIDEIMKKSHENTQGILGNEKDIAQLSNPNLLINGDFQVWQRGTSFLNVINTGIYTSDRWLCYGNASHNGSVFKTIKGIKLISNTSASYSRIKQTFEDDFKNKLLGKEVTLSINVKNIQGGALFYVMDGGAGFVNANLYKGINTVTFKMKDIFTSYFGIAIQVNQGATGDYIELEWVKLELGSKATPFVPRTYAEELAMCQRYYEKSYRSDMYPGTDTYSGRDMGKADVAIAFSTAGIFNLGRKLIYSQRKRIAPTVTLYGRGTGLAPNTIYKNAQGSCRTGCTVYSVTAGDMGFESISVDNSSNSVAFSIGDMFEFNWVADAEIY